MIIAIIFLIGLMLPAAPLRHPLCFLGSNGELEWESSSSALVSQIDRHRLALPSMAFEGADGTSHIARYYI